MDDGYVAFSTVTLKHFRAITICRHIGREEAISFSPTHQPITQRIVYTSASPVSTIIVIIIIIEDFYCAYYNLDHRCSKKS